jgi:hypothetical protein
MSDETRDREHAEAYWRDVVEPTLKRLIIETHMDGAKNGRLPFTQWLQSMPIARTETVKPPGKKAGSAKRAASRITSPSAPARNRPLRGAGLAAFDAVKRRGSLTSRELLGELRKMDGGRLNDQRDNTLLAAIRRLRQTGRLAYDGVHYTLPNKEAPTVPVREQTGPVE